MICADSAHIHVDECGAPEKVAGLKLLTVPTPDGKLTPELIDRQAYGFDDEHPRAQPAVVAITQSTELGTCYTPEEIRAIADHVHSLGMKLYVDGARLANAAATLNVPLREFTTDAGVDVLSFGGTKNGLDARRVHRRARPDAVHSIKYLRKAGHAARLEDALPLGAVRGAARHRPVAAQRPARERHGAAPVRGREEPRGSPGSPARSRPTRSSRSCRRRLPSACRSVSVSTRGTSTPARCAG